VLAASDNTTTQDDLRLNNFHSLSYDKLATSTRTPNRYDMDSLKSKTISQDLELEANRHKGTARIGGNHNFEALS
jgi:hypothetical protein